MVFARRRVAILRASVVAALSAGVLTLATGCTGLTTGPADPTSVADQTAGPQSSGAAAAAASSPTTDPSRDVQTAAWDLTARRIDALAAKDKAAWMGTLADRGSPFGVEQAALFDRMTSLPLSRLSNRSVIVDPAPTGTAGTTSDASGGSGVTSAAPTNSTPGTATPSGAEGGTASTAVGATWLATLDLGYKLTGYDRAERVYELSYLMTRTPDGWRFSGTGPRESDPQPFDLPGLEVASSPSTLVIGDAPVSSLRAYVALGDTAHDRIAAIWGEAVPAVIIVPRTADELAAQLGITTGSLQQVAGITNGPTSDGVTAGSDRVYINPDATAKLSAVGRQVIVSHELTHVTTRATTVRRPPTWLSEGFADYVGLKASGLSNTSVASALLDQVRAGKVPTALPGAVDFDPAKSTIEPAYNEAWLAITLMQRKYGEEKVVAFYRAVCGTPTAAPPSGTTADELAQRAFENVLGTTQGEFVKEWVAYLTKLAR